MNEWTDKQWRDRNDNVIPDFRAAGKDTRPNLLVLTTKGAKTGNPHVTPLIYLEDAGRFCVFASKGGNPKNPAWYHNLVALPDVTIELKGETFPARATVPADGERDRLASQLVSHAVARLGEPQGLVGDQRGEHARDQGDARECRQLDRDGDQRE